VLATQGGPGLDDFRALALDANTGQFLWQDRSFVPTSAANAAVAVDIERRRAFVAGAVQRIPGLGEEDLLVRAYDSQTGSFDWEDRFPGPNPGVDRCLCHPNDLVAHRGRLLVVGSAMFPPGSIGPPNSWIVRAHDAKSGGLIWSDDFAPVGGTGTSVFAVQGARAVAADGGRVFVVGSGINASGNADFIVRAYDAK
jgi:outer membrane protein assembly factor BamB